MVDCMSFAKITIIILSACSATTFLTSPAAAMASTDEIQGVRYDRSDIERNARKATEIQETNPGIRSKIYEHLADVSQSGRTVSVNDLMVTSLPDPFSKSSEITVIWDSNAVPESVGYARNNHGVVGAQTTTTTREFPQGKNGIPVTQNRASAFGINNLLLGPHGCTTTFFKPNLFGRKRSQVDLVLRNSRTRQDPAVRLQ